MFFYVFYYDPAIELVGPFIDRQIAVEWALSSERKRERPTLWVIVPTSHPYKQALIVAIIDPERKNGPET